MMLDWDRPLFTRQGRLTETVLGQMTHLMEATCKSPDRPDGASAGLIDSVYQPATECVSQAP